MANKILLTSLPQLQNIIDEFDKEIHNFETDSLDHVDILNHYSENDIHDMVEHIMEDLDNNIQNNMNIYVSEYYDKEFHDLLENTILNHFYILENLDIELIHKDVLIDELKERIYNMYSIYNPHRSHKNNLILIQQTESFKKYIDTRINSLNTINKTLPEQRSEEWYKMRYNLLSASSIYKAIGTQASQNSLIFGKCKPLEIISNSNNINTPFHWGQKYEPIAQMYYEHIYDAEIAEYGCIPHPKYDFLGASPDGINVKRSSNRYGRMLEIKNVVSRQLTGIPKKEYWIQTQLQMEVCNLDECDFLECDFVEYNNETDFLNDGEFNMNDDGCYKGVILQFCKDYDTPFYVYMPFNMDQSDFIHWKEQQINNSEHRFITTIYWKLNEVSCVLIERNKNWFNSVVNDFKKIWDTILHERQHGYEHRKPKSRNKNNFSICQLPSPHMDNSTNETTKNISISIDTSSTNKRCPLINLT